MDAQTLIARRIAQELRSGMLVNLGIGIPTLVANFLPAGVHVFFQSENGVVGTGPIPEEGMAHPMLTDAAGLPVTLLPGAATFDTAMSFGLIRGGHIDISVLGGLQVDESGLLANWMIPGKMVPGMEARWTWPRRKTRGGRHAAHGQGKEQDRQAVHAAAHLDTAGASCRDRLGRDLVSPGRATLLETAPGVTIDDVLTNTDATLIVPEQVAVMRLDDETLRA